jgi:hypothetical protein
MRHISECHTFPRETMRRRGASAALFLAVFCTPLHACPPDFYPADAWPHACLACPPHTSMRPSGGGGSNAHDCKCDAGFLCMYYKHVHARVTVNTTLSAFERDEGAIRTAFIAGVAAAAGVTLEQVHVHFVVIRLDHRRRRARRRALLGLGYAQLRVTVTVPDTFSDMSRLRAHLGITSDDSAAGGAWVVERRVLVLAIPSGRI